MVPKQMAIRHVKLHFPQILLTNTLCCSFGMVSADSFDPAEPAGEYCFDMSEPLSRLVVRDLLKIEAMGKGQFQRLTVTLDLDYDTDEPNPKNYNLKKMVDFDREADVPERGELYFRFVSLRKPPWAGGDTELSHSVFESLIEHFKNNSRPLAGEHRVGKIEFLKVLLVVHPDVMAVFESLFSHFNHCSGK